MSNSSAANYFLRCDKLTDELAAEKEAHDRTKAALKKQTEENTRLKAFLAQVGTQADAQVESLRTEVQTQKNLMAEVLKRAEKAEAEAEALRTKMKNLNETKAVFGLESDNNTKRKEVLHQIGLQLFQSIGRVQDGSLWTKAQTQNMPMAKTTKSAEEAEAEAEALRTGSSDSQALNEIKTQLATERAAFSNGYVRFDKELTDAQAQIQRLRAQSVSQAQELKNSQSQLVLAKEHTLAQKFLVAQTLRRAEEAEGRFELLRSHAQAETDEFKNLTMILRGQIDDLKDESQIQIAKFETEKAKLIERESKALKRAHEAEEALSAMTQVKDKEMGSRTEPKSKSEEAKAETFPDMDVMMKELQKLSPNPSSKSEFEKIKAEIAALFAPGAALATPTSFASLR